MIRTFFEFANLQKRLLTIYEEASSLQKGKQIREMFENRDAIFLVFRGREVMRSHKKKDALMKS